MSNLVDHARRELEIVGEDEHTKAGLLKVVAAFAEMGHSGASAHFSAEALDRLLRYRPLSDLTDDPAEWQHHSEEVWGAPGGIWQSRRNPEAFSTDGGKTYYLLSERDATSDDVTPLHTAVAS